MCYILSYEKIWWLFPVTKTRYDAVVGSTALEDHSVDVGRFLTQMSTHTGFLTSF